MGSKILLQRIRLEIGILLVLVLLGGLAWGLRGQGLRVALLSRARAFLSTARAVLGSSSVAATGGFTNVIFLHHSTGANLIEQGGVRETLALWDFAWKGHIWGYSD